MHFSIIIPAYNEEGYIERTLDSLYPQELPPDTNFSLIVVNNNSTDKTRQVVENFIRNKQAQNIIILDESVKGVVPTRRTGAEKAIELYGNENHWLVSCDADSIYSKIWLKNFWQTIKQNPEVDFISGSSKNDNTLNNYSKMLDALKPAFELSRKLLENNSIPPISDSISCFSAKLYRSAGGYSREFINGVEQMAETWRLYIRAHSLGFKRAFCQENISVPDGRRDTVQFLDLIKKGGMAEENFSQDIRIKDFKLLEKINANPKRFITQETLDEIVLSRVALQCFVFQLVSEGISLKGNFSHLADDFLEYKEKRSHRHLYLFKPSLVFQDALEIASILRPKIL